MLKVKYGSPGAQFQYFEGDVGFGIGGNTALPLENCPFALFMKAQKHKAATKNVQIDLILNLF